MTDANLQVAREWIDGARRIVVFSGAGLSTESGIPTFRDTQKGAFWEDYDPMALASQEGFAADRRLVVEWYGYRARIIAEAKPNAAHRAIGAFDAAHPGKVVNITQNIDGLLQRAGASVVHELHGTILRDRCNNSGCDYRAQAKMYNAGDDIPMIDCPKCGGPMRPDVVWFGEPLPTDVWRLSEKACLQCNLMICVGTSGAVYPAAGLVQLARASDSRIVIVNPNRTEIDELAHASFHQPAGEILPELLRAG